MTGNGRVIVGCTHGEEDPDRVAVAYLTAGAALDQGKEVVMWLTVEGVRLALEGYAAPIRAAQEPPVERLHAQFIEDDDEPSSDLRLVRGSLTGREPSD